MDKYEQIKESVKYSLSLIEADLENPKKFPWYKRKRMILRLMGARAALKGVQEACQYIEKVERTGNTLTIDTTEEKEPEEGELVITFYPGAGPRREGQEIFRKPAKDATGRDVYNTIINHAFHKTNPKA